MTRTLPTLLTLFITTLATAAPLQLPKTAIPADTFFVATIDLAKASPEVFEATMKAALADKADDAAPVLEHYKKYHTAAVAGGAQTITAVFHGDPNAQKAPEPIFYVHFKGGSDQAPVEKQIREAEGENCPNPMEISADGDFMLLRAKGITPPEAGSDERTAAFAEVITPSDKPVVAAMIFTPEMVESFKKEVARGMPPAMLSFITDSKSVRIELTMGETPKADFTVQAPDEDAAKRVADAVSSLASMMTAQIAQMKQLVAAGGAAQFPPDFATMVDSMTAVAEALKPNQAGATVTLTAGDKAVGGIFRGWFTARKMEAQAAPSKGGL